METPTLQELTKILTSPPAEVLSERHVILRKISAGLILFVSDILVLTFSIFLSLFLRNLILSGHIQFADYLMLFPFVIPLFPLGYFLRGLYPGFGIDVIEELRNLTYTTTIVFAILAAMSFFMPGTWEFSRVAFILSWLTALAAVPLGRAMVRKFFGAKSWWGIPVIVLGAGQAGEQVIKSLLKHLHIGLRPIVAIDDDIDRWGYISDIPVIGGLEIVPELAAKLKIDHAIIAMPRVPRQRQQEIILKYSKYFNHTTVIPDLYGLSSLWVSTRDLGGILGLEVKRSLLRKSSQIKKRIFDFTLALMLSIIFVPLYLLISFAIYFDSRGRILFHQKRMGIKDSRFRIVKFRTMHYNAESRLHELLDENEDLKAEFDVYHKLRNDPRLTRIGSILRKFSLDELPQFWNVIKGEMSLIGPRAYLPWEKYKMNGYEDMILKVKPGISGLWQVTDRNQSSFEERNLIDVYYIRNWSMFLDIYILARTVAVVLTGRGG